MGPLLQLIAGSLVSLGTSTRHGSVMAGPRGGCMCALVWQEEVCVLGVQARSVSSAPTFFLGTQHLTEATALKREGVG